MAKSYSEMTEDELLTAMRGKQSTDFAYIEMKAELDRRVAIRDLEAGAAQIRSSWFQLTAVVAMFLTTIFTAWVTWMAAGRH